MSFLTQIRAGYTEKARQFITPACGEYYDACQSGFHYTLMLGFMIAVSGITPGLLELRVLQKWLISIQLHSSERHRQECVCVSVKETQAGIAGHS